MKVTVVRAEAGIPLYILEGQTQESHGGESNIFYDHLGLFITMIIVALVCIIVIIVGLILMKRCRNDEYYVRNIHDKVGAISTGGHSS